MEIMISLKKLKGIKKLKIFINPVLNNKWYFLFGILGILFYYTNSIFEIININIFFNNYVLSQLLMKTFYFSIMPFCIGVVAEYFSKSHSKEIITDRILITGLGYSALLIFLDGFISMFFICLGGLLVFSLRKKLLSKYKCWYLIGFIDIILLIALTIIGYERGIIFTNSLLHTIDLETLTLFFIILLGGVTGCIISKISTYKKAIMGSIQVGILQLIVYVIIYWYVWQIFIINPIPETVSLPPNALILSDILMRLLPLIFPSNIIGGIFGRKINIILNNVKK